MKSIVAGTRCVLAFALVAWTVCASTWLVTLTAHEHCPTTDHSNNANEIRLDVREHAAIDIDAAEDPPLRNSTNLHRAASIGEKSVSVGALKNYASRIFRGTDIEEGCTMVILTYKRVEMLLRVLEHYCNIVTLKRIVVVWNDVDSLPPQRLLSLSGCKVDVRFVLSKENRLTNRYLPRKEIVTECVCLMDDDRIIEAEDMKFGFEVWKSYRHRIVGFEERSFVKKEGKYVYTNYERRRFLKMLSGKSNNNLPPGYKIESRNGTSYLRVKNKTFPLGDSNIRLSKNLQFPSSQDEDEINGTIKSEGYNIMLNSCFLHRVYLELYFDPLVVPSSLVEYVNEKMNCEDILMSVAVTKFLKDIDRPQCGVLAIKSGWVDDSDNESLGEGERGGLSARPDHYETRSLCLEKFSQVYGYLPLKTSRLIMNKVSYRI